MCIKLAYLYASTVHAIIFIFQWNSNPFDSSFIRCDVCTRKLAFNRVISSSLAVAHASWQPTHGSKLENCKLLQGLVRHSCKRYQFHCRHWRHAFRGEWICLGKWRKNKVFVKSNDAGGCKKAYFLYMRSLIHIFTVWSFTLHLHVFRRFFFSLSSPFRGY